MNLSHLGVKPIAPPVEAPKLPILQALHLPPNTPPPTRHTKPVYPDKEKTAELIGTLQCALLIESLTPLAANAREHLRALLEGCAVYAKDWHDHVTRTYQPNARWALETYVPNWGALHPSVQNKLVREMEDEIKTVRRFAQSLRDITDLQAGLLENITEQERADLDAVQAEITRRMTIADIPVLLPHWLDDGAFYLIVCKAGAVHRMTQYDHAHRCFVYQTTKGEHGAVPLSDVTHAKPLAQTTLSQAA